ncbi:MULTISPECIES: lysozyme family protein [Vagococcus]|uniref:lysozyme family protein n=1 Tax=Vagococcus TaxID=2737 RepID=UPI002FC705FC
MKKKKKHTFKKILLLLLLIGLIAGFFVYKKVSAQVEDVLHWEDQVSKATKEYGIESYTDIVLAIIFTESKGNHVDIMQSSESKYGQRNLIMSSEESIDSGVEHLAEVLKEAEEKGCDVWTAVQAYNFGSQYISYVAEKGQINSLELAETYSRDVLAPLLGNTTQETYTYKHPLALIYNKGKLYRDGGNFFYAESVKWNLKLIKLFK